MKNFNEWLATKITNSVSTMTCAYIFGAIALLALPQAYHDTFVDGFHALPMVTWLSQAFLQLVLLSIIMVGQTVQGKTAETRAETQFNAVMEILGDVRADHAASAETIKDLQTLMTEETQDETSLADIQAKLDVIEANVDKILTNGVPATYD